MDSDLESVTIFLLLFFFQVRDNPVLEHKMGPQIHLPIISKADQRYWRHRLQGSNMKTLYWMLPEFAFLRNDHNVFNDYTGRLVI